MKNLSPKHLKFIEEYLKCGEAKKAAIAAGYAPKNANVKGCQLLKHPLIKKEIEERQKRIKQKGVLDTEKFVKFLKNVMRRAYKGYPIRENGKTIAFKMDAAALVGSANLLAKIAGLDKISIEHEVGGSGGFGIQIQLKEEQP